MGRKVLVTGGAGYIGSVVVEQLLSRGDLPIVLDDLSTGHRAAVASGAEFIEGNVGDRLALERLFARHTVDALMHLAAFALVAESVADPAKYRANNVAAGAVLLDAAVAAGVRRVIFSSSCTIDACAIPTEPSSLTDFTSNGNFKRFGRRTFRFIGNTAKFGTFIR